ncbi:MAG: permease-like cell division protein FtsX [Elusimicrobiota bacterium]
MRPPQRWPVHLMVLGFVLGLMTEGLLFLRGHCARAEFLLLEDFRVLAFVSPGVSTSRRKLMEEELLALPATESLRYVSPEESLAEMESDDPTLSQSVAVLGDNPLPGALEVQLIPERLPGLKGWLKDAERIDGIAEVVYKQRQFEAIVQLQFYRRFMALVLSLAACVWGFAVAWLLARAGLRPGALVQGLWPWGDMLRRAAAGGAGTAAGAAAALLAALPANSGALLHAWPAAWLQAALVFSGAVAAGVWGTPPLRRSSRTVQPGAAASSRELTLFGALCLLLIPGPGSAAAPISAKRRELKAINEEMDRKRKEFDLLQQRQEDLRRDLSDLQKKRRRSQQTMDSLRSELEDTHRKSERLGSQLSVLERTHGGQRELLADELGTLVRRSAGQFAFYGSQDLWSGSFRRAAIREKTLYLAQLRVVQGRAAAEHEQAVRRNGELTLRARRALSELGVQQKRLRLAEKDYREVQKDARITRKRLQELTESAQALTKLLKSLGRSAKGGKGQGGKTPPVSKHSLPWPIRGDVVSTFGKRRVPEFDSWVIRNGIEIKASGETVVRTVGRGKVIFAGPFRSYGNTIIVEHGSGFYSIYGYLDRIEIREGDSLRPDERLATVGGPNGGRGALYLELRQGGVPLNPIVWLEKR